MKFTCSWSTQIIKQQIEFLLLDIVLVCQIVWGGNLACWRPLAGWSGSPVRAGEVEAVMSPELVRREGPDRSGQSLVRRSPGGPAWEGI